jgi:hypothetical protein
MAKLTLSVDAAVVRDAKRYAAAHGTSVSSLVERYLELLARPTTPSLGPETPVLERLRGILKGRSTDEAAYRHHLERKYR